MGWALAKPIAGRICLDGFRLHLRQIELRRKRSLNPSYGRAISAYFDLHYGDKSGLFREWIRAERNIMWNDQLDAKLLRLRKEGLSFAEVAERMGLSRNTVLGRAQRLAGKQFPSQIARSERRRRRNDARARQAAAKEKAISKKLKKDLASGVPRDVAVRAALNLGGAPKLVAGIIGVSSERVCQIRRKA
jgi:transcriptional regulator with XRE-family HTH domain